MEETNKISDYTQGVVLNSLKDGDISVVLSANSNSNENVFKAEDHILYKESLNDDYNAGISFK